MNASMEEIVGHPDIFDHVVAPFLFGNVDYDSMWQINRSDKNDLYGTLAGQSSSPPRHLVNLAPKPGRSLTYGEVRSCSIAAHVLPGLMPGLDFAKFDSGAAAGSSSAATPSEAVFVDLGSGTGKIPMHVWLLHQGEQARRARMGQDAMPPLTCLGLELATDRHNAGVAALQKAAEATTMSLLPFVRRAVTAGLIGPSVLRKGMEPVLAAVLAVALNGMSTAVKLLREDILTADLSSVTTVFLNNKVFEPALMASLGARLADNSPLVGAYGAGSSAAGSAASSATRAPQMPQLRALVILEPLCARHRARCISQGSSCAGFHDEPVKGFCHPTWDNTCDLWWYYPKSRPEPGLAFPEEVQPGRTSSSPSATVSGSSAAAFVHSTKGYGGSAASAAAGGSAAGLAEDGARAAAGSPPAGLSQGSAGSIGAPAGAGEPMAGYVTPKNSGIPWTNQAPNAPARPSTRRRIGDLPAAPAAAAAGTSADMDGQSEDNGSGLVPPPVIKRGGLARRLDFPNDPNEASSSAAAAVPTPTAKDAGVSSLKRPAEAVSSEPAAISPARPSKRTATASAVASGSTSGMDMDMDASGAGAGTSAPLAYGLFTPPEYAEKKNGASKVGATPATVPRREAIALAETIERPKASSASSDGRVMARKAGSASKVRAAAAAAEQSSASAGAAGAPGTVRSSFGLSSRR